MDKQRKEQKLTADEIASISSSYVPTPAEQVFIDGLNELTKRTGVRITGCGCCGSPWLADGATDGHYELSSLGDCLRWVSNHG